MGITYPQYLVLLVLWENDGLYVNQITEAALSTIHFRHYKTHGKMELLQRTRSIEDERVLLCS
jgi:DNA-binding MarR family transcriptional regulator